MIKSYKKSKSYKYAKDVLLGKILACKFIKKQAKSYLNDLKREDLYFDYDWHHKVTVFFNEVVCVPEFGHPVDIPPPHAFWIEQVYCIRYKRNKLRKYKSVYMQVARKNFKTYEAGCLSLFELLYGNDLNAEIMCGANSRNQAIICTKMMGQIIKKSPLLKELRDDGIITTFTQKKEVTEIIYETDERDGRIEAMPREVGDGGNPSATIIDELHEAKDLALLETMKSGQGQRREPINIVITSPGHFKDGPCYSVLRKKSIDLLNGMITDDRHLPILFELDDEKDWDNIDELEKSNPMMPYSETLKDNLLERILEAKNEGGFTEVSVKIKNSGIWVDAADVWIQHETVVKNDHGITDKELLGKPCFVGIDLAKAHDLNACALLFPNIRKNVHAVKMMYWIPSDKMNDNKDHVDYRRWVDQKYMIVQDGNVADHELIAKDMITMFSKYDIRSVGFDNRFAYAGIVPALAHAGYEDKLMSVGQGYTGLSAAVTQMFNWMLRYEMDLMGHKVLYWNIANTIMKTGDEGDMIPSKGKSNMRIDGTSAVLDAVAEYLRIGAEPEKFYGFAVLK